MLLLSFNAVYSFKVCVQFSVHKEALQEKKKEKKPNPTCGFESVKRSVFGSSW